MVKLYVKTFSTVVLSFLAMVLAGYHLGACGSSDRQGDGAACVALCTGTDAAHLPACVNACAANGNDAELATAEVKEACEVTEDPDPTATLKNICTATCWVTIRPSMRPGSLDIGICMGSSTGLVTTRIVGSPPFPVATFTATGIKSSSMATAQTSAINRCAFGFNTAPCQMTDANGGDGPSTTLSCSLVR